MDRFLAQEVQMRRRVQIGALSSMGEVQIDRREICFAMRDRVVVDESIQFAVHWMTQPAEPRSGLLAEEPRKQKIEEDRRGAEP